MNMDYCTFEKYLDDLQENTIKPGLERVREACLRFDNPQASFKAVHIAGTNGKGSVAAYLESIFRNNGYKVGLYTSPHLVSVRERIQINRDLISKENISKYADLVCDKCHDIGLSYFEFLTIICFLYFKDAKVDFAVLETGLGGRWDATNIVSPLLTVMTPISIDHKSILGNDLVSIAGEKAGIVKRGVTLVSSFQESEAQDVLKVKCLELGSDLKCLEAGIDDVILSNRMLAKKAADHLANMGFNLQVKDDYLNISLTGRFQKVSDDPEIIIDGAHNVAGISALICFLRKNHFDRNIVFINNIMKDKEIQKIYDLLLNVGKKFIYADIDNFRSCSFNEIRKISSKIKYAESLLNALGMAKDSNLKNPLIVVTGSLYLVGRFLKQCTVHCSLSTVHCPLGMSRIVFFTSN